MKSSLENMMSRRIKAVIAFFSLNIVLLGALCANPQNRFGAFLKEAETLYANEKFQNAIDRYQHVADSGFHSSELYYNIGNAYFKLGDISRSILNYERALLLAPTDGDILFNLEKSRTYVVDNIEVIPEFFIKSWLRKTIVIFNSNAWAVTALMAFLFATLFLLVFFIARKVVVKKVMLPVSIIALLVFLFSIIFSSRTKGYVEDSNYAIIMQSTVTVKSSPDNGGVDVFIIHEGTKVNVLRSLADWHEIKLADGKQGWLSAEEIEKI